MNKERVAQAALFYLPIITVKQKSQMESDFFYWYL